MGIYIKGMEMPKYGCDNCFLRTGNYCGRIEKDESVVEYVRKNERHPDCPLVRVPPHGDLIEAEPIMKFITDGLNSGEFGYDQIKVLTEIQYAPIVIPADMRGADNG